MTSPQEELDQYRRILDTLPESVSLYDENLECIYVNQALVDESGSSCAEYLGRSIETILESFPDDQAQAWIETMERLANGTGPPVRDTMTVEEATGTIHLEATASRIESETGDLLCVANVMRDITERVEQQRALQRQNERLEEFASIVSHDLQNPLNTAEGRLQLLQEDDEVDSQHLEPARRAIERSQRLITELLELARQGEDVGEMRPVALDRVATTCWQAVATQESRLSVEVEQPLLADVTRLRQLLQNLFENAIRHGGGDVTVTVGPLGDGFYVADDGVGLSADADERVFEAGYSETRDGTGFGLSIVKRIVDAHGWDIRLTTSAEGGAQFEITDVEFA